MLESLDLTCTEGYVKMKPGIRGSRQLTKAYLIRRPDRVSIARDGEIDSTTSKVHDDLKNFRRTALYSSLRAPFMMVFKALCLTG